VFGYTVANDVSARDVQFGDGQWVRGKSLDTFCPLGPVVVTADEIEDPQSLGLRTRVNGELVQDSSTSEMVFGVAELVSYCSHSFTLEPGDVILTGTPWGCGEFMDPPRSLAPGDVVEVEVDGIGTLRNPVEEARG
jgi:2-keto-4-pentenoate hydratase/2-oxohepta-3-ene-1,7-dioic acid hydratase in catechol pathway